MWETKPFLISIAYFVVFNNILYKPIAMEMGYPQLIDSSRIPFSLPWVH
ncbi:protein of unknown function [Methanocaldococcus lauensis]|uniref:Uncharacterized protein n=1 Tax=Methanocaldococcus lauensis TaxID=2546128 RepID=A0A8D6PVH8_9EURY|nr:protein of unknown function [Methanocaldococcus lauensis]